MLIDWFTVGAQTLNFIILVVLMKRFLYQPILDAIDQRETGIAQRLADAAAKHAEAQRQRDEYQRKNDAFDAQREALLGSARKAAETEGQRLLAEARQSADAQRAQRQRALLDEAQRLNVDLTRRTQHEVFAITRKVLADLATAGLEAMATDAFVQRLQALDGPARTAFAQALAATTGPARVRSAFELPAAQRTVIQRAVHQCFVADLALQFETAPALVAGIELVVNGQKLAWSIAEHLASMQTAVDDLMAPPAAGEAAAPPPAPVPAAQ